MRPDRRKDKKIAINGFQLTLLGILAVLILIRMAETFLYPGSEILPPDFFLAMAIAQIFFLWFSEVKERGRLIWLQEKKEELSDMKSKFTLVTSHELMTPVTVIKGYMKLLKDKRLGGLTSKQEDALGVIDKYVERLETIKSNLTKFSLAKSGSLIGNFEIVSMSYIAGSIIEDMKPFFEQRQQSIKVSLEDRIPAIKVDENGVRQVIVNLLLNAIRFTPDKGAIIIRVKEERDNVRVEVEDNGIGIPGDKLKSVFESYYELQDVKKHSSGNVEFKSSGIGLGLPIAKSIIDLHKGSIWVESEVDKYSRFIFTLPKNS